MSEKVKPSLLSCYLLCTGCLALLTGYGAQAATPSTNWVAATAAPQNLTISAFASVQSSGLITVAPSQAGIIGGLDVLPGQSVASEQVIAHLGGPQITAAIIQAQELLASAGAAQNAAERSLAAERQKLQHHLSTNQLVTQAESSLATATAQTATAQSNLDMLRQAAVLRIPVAGVVQTVTVANGDVLAAGQIVATVQPDTGRWLKAVFYDATAQDLSPRTTGLFTPANGKRAVRVAVRGALGVSQADGGMPVALVATEPIAPGMFGTVTLDLPKQTVNLVPSEALILDKGQWWVMKHDAAGDHPVQVLPGPAHGYETIIRSGVTAGDDIDVVDAYLLYHRGIAALYQPPD